MWIMFAEGDVPCKPLGASKRRVFEAASSLAICIFIRNDCLLPCSWISCLLAGKRVAAGFVSPSSGGGSLCLCQTRACKCDPKRVPDGCRHEGSSPRRIIDPHPRKGAVDIERRHNRRTLLYTLQKPVHAAESVPFITIDGWSVRDLYPLDKAIMFGVPRRAFNPEPPIVLPTSLAQTNSRRRTSCHTNLFHYLQHPA